MSSCCFCPIQKLTPWWKKTEDGIVVCKDLNRRGYNYRILVVGSGSRWHRSFGSFSDEEINRFIRLGREVAEKHIKEGKAIRIAHTDLDHLSISSHWHLQIAME